MCLWKAHILWEFLKFFRESLGISAVAFKYHSASATANDPLLRKLLEYSVWCSCHSLILKSSP